jgi:hypothetical protein
MIYLTKDIYCFALFNTAIDGDKILETKQPNTKLVTFSKKKLVAIAVVALVIVIATALTSGLLLTRQNSSSSQTNNQNNSQSWIVIGAYAAYEGQGNVLSTPISIDARMEIIGLNETYIQVLTNYNMSTPYGVTGNTSTTWVSRENMTFQPVGLTLNDTYSTQITLPNLGTRSCTVYEYNSQGISTTYYVDNSIQWPIKIVMTSPTFDGLSYTMDINLVNSNIPGL